MKSNRSLFALMLVLTQGGALAASEDPANENLEPRVAPGTIQIRIYEERQEEEVEIALATLPAAMTVKNRSSLRQVADDLRGGRTEQAVRRWERLVSVVSRGAAPVDHADLIHWLLRQAYLDPSRDLRDYADRVRFFNVQQEAIRDHLYGTRKVLSSMPRNSQAQVQVIDVAPQYGFRAEPTRPGMVKKMSDRELAEHIQHWEEQLQAVGDDAQLANVDLQNALQKQQQTLQMMASISKMLHDTASSVIRKIG